MMFVTTRDEERFVSAHESCIIPSAVTRNTDLIVFRDDRLTKILVLPNDTSRVSTVLCGVDFLRESSRCRGTVKPLVEVINNEFIPVIRWSGVRRLVSVSR